MSHTCSNICKVSLSDDGIDADDEYYAEEPYAAEDSWNEDEMLESGIRRLFPLCLRYLRCGYRRSRHQ